MRQLSLPRLGFLGVGWIGRLRMRKLVDSGLAEVAALADPSPAALAEALELAPGAISCVDLDELLGMKLDGLVIATPSALHADQTMRALNAGVAVFCQKPLGRSAAENRQVVEVARRTDRLLGVDFCYRHLEGVRRIKALLDAGELGDVYAARVVFHNAYGPDKPWFYDRRQSGGGCLMDLGIHLVDLALWMLDEPHLRNVTGRCYAQGRPLEADHEAQVEDYAIARLDLDGGKAVEIACSWNLSAGRDAVIEATFNGTRGSAELRNVDGSFYDFRAWHHRGTQSVCLVHPPDNWGGRALLDWVGKLARSPGYRREIESVLSVAEVIDAIYRGEKRIGTGRTVGATSSRTLPHGVVPAVPGR